MAVEFDETLRQFIDFGLVPTVHNLAQKTVMVFFRLDTLPTTEAKLLADKGQTLAAAGWSVTFLDQPGLTDRFSYTHNWSVSNGVWYTDDNVVTTSVRNFAVTYDRGATGNDPIFYVDGAPVAVNETSTPNGVVDDDSGQDLWIGAVDHAADKSIDGIINGAFIWDRLLSAGELASISALRTVRGHRKGLVWGCRFVGASGLQEFDGETLAGGNKFVDMINGAQGTPTGSPVGRADIYMAYR